MPADQQTFLTTFTQSSDEWWTPQWIIDATWKTLGHITLDPASTPLANERIWAANILTREHNGLKYHWFGNVFLNPPSRRGDPTGRPHLWAGKLIAEYEALHVEEAILLVKSALGYSWYEDLYRRFWVCHLRERPEFVKPDGSTVGQAKKGVSVFYFGRTQSGHDHFYDSFKDYGRIIPPMSNLHFHEGVKWI